MYIYNYKSTKGCSITNTNLNYFLIFPQFTTNVHYYDSSYVYAILANLFKNKLAYYKLVYSGVFYLLRIQAICTVSMNPEMNEFNKLWLKNTMSMISKLFFLDEYYRSYSSFIPYIIIIIIII